MEELRTFNQRKEVSEENKSKAYTLIFGFCNKTMKGQIEEAANFETEIRDDPVKLLEEIKRKMYNPA